MLRHAIRDTRRSGKDNSLVIIMLHSSTRYKAAPGKNAIGPALSGPVVKLWSGPAIGLAGFDGGFCSGTLPCT